MRVTDLLNIDRQLNVTGDSVLNVFMLSDSEMEDQRNPSFVSSNLSSRQSDANRRSAQRRELVGDSVHCVAISRLCNQLNDCPNGEDEDDCPRPRDNLRDILQYYTNLGKIVGLAELLLLRFLGRYNFRVDHFICRTSKHTRLLGVFLFFVAVPEALGVRY